MIPVHARRRLWLRTLLIAGAIVGAGSGCQCYGPVRIRPADVAALSACPRPSRVGAAGTPGGRVPVAWVGSFQRSRRQGESTVLEYRFAVVRDFPALLRDLRRGEPTVLDPGRLEESEEAFEVRIRNSHNPERMPEVASPWPVALWTGTAEREGDRAVLYADDIACELRLGTPSK